MRALILLPLLAACQNTPESDTASGPDIYGVYPIDADCTASVEVTIEIPPGPVLSVIAYTEEGVAYPMGAGWRQTADGLVVTCVRGYEALTIFVLSE